MDQWRDIQKNNFKSIEALKQFLQIDEAIPCDRSFPLNIPQRLVKKMEKKNPNDPLLLQFLPSLLESTSTPGFVDDPVGDCTHQKTARLLQKYEGRALLITTSACAMHCRFCFRQNYPYLKSSSFEEEIEIIRNDPTVHEVILSGGDPLSLSDEKLEQLVTHLEAIPHVKLLRFHSRFPIGIPERITERFVKMITKSSLQTIFILHTNHPKELDEDIFYFLKKIPAPILTQTVLMKGVNDRLETLKTLFLTLITHGIIPYYLHQLDRVRQAARFEVPIQSGLALMEELRKVVPGYALPRYVQEIPDKASKTPLA